MPGTRIVIPALLILLANRGTLLGSPAAESDASPATNAPAMAAEIRHEEGPGLFPANRAYVVAGTNKFAFLVPQGLKLETWNDKRVALVTRDYSSQITFSLAGPLPAEGSELDADAYSSKLLEENPGAKIVSTFSSFADSRRGPAYEVELPGPAGSWRRAIIAYIPSRGGVLKFSLVCSPELFDKARQQLSTVMLTFRASDARGELHISPLSDKI